MLQSLNGYQVDLINCIPVHQRSSYIENEDEKDVGKEDEKEYEKEVEKEVEKDYEEVVTPSICVVKEDFGLEDYDNVGTNDVKSVDSKYSLIFNSLLNFGNSESSFKCINKQTNEELVVEEFELNKSEIAKLEADTQLFISYKFIIN